MGKLPTKNTDQKHCKTFWCLQQKPKKNYNSGRSKNEIKACKVSKIYWKACVGTFPSPAQPGPIQEERILGRRLSDFTFELEILTMTYSTP